MKLRFGHHLDGQHGSRPDNRLGCADVGPLGLLGILEIQLGLAAAPVSSAERAVQYRNCLYKLNEPGRFYNASLAADDFGIAAELLAWRDTWRLHGWSGSIANGSATSRLADMAEVEKMAIGQVAPGIAERLAAVDAALANRKLLIASIELVDPLQSFPALWQAVLKRLPCSPPSPSPIRGKGFLGDLQRTLVEGGKPPVWRDDGSLFVARSETVTAGARWLGETLHRESDDALLVATSEASSTDAHLAAAGQPRQGLGETSAFRPALQLLPISLELLWAPVNFHALIQFLTHPISPIPSRARRKLAAIQSEYPGVGGPRWQKVLEELAVGYGDRAGKTLDTIAFWVEHERFNPEVGAPIGIFMERAQRLAEFFRNSAPDASPAIRYAHASGQNQCLSFCENLSRLAAQGVTSLRPRQAEQLAAQATAHGNDNPLRLAEAGAVPSVTHPGAAIDDYATVFWGPLDAPPLPGAWPWSQAEIAALADAGCRLPEPGDLLQREAEDWLKPILAARERLVLLLPPKDHEIHPIWQTLETLIEGVPVTPVETCLTDPAAGLDIVPKKPLPAIRRWWQLPRGTPVPATSEFAYSQLEKLVFNPYHWLLAYGARLRPGSLLSLADDFRLRGILAHSLVERLYEASGGRDMADAEFTNWFDTAFDRLIAEEGAVYLMPGRRTDLENLRQTLHRALTELRQLLRRSGVSAVAAERKLSGHFTGGPLVGTCDLVLEKGNGATAIVDMKWAGKSHQERLEENRHLQLAIYGELMRQTSGNWPSLAYFLISSGRLLTRDDIWFAGITPVSDKKGENSAQLWQRFLKTWAWRQAQFAEGSFEVVLEEGTDLESQAPEDGLATEVLNSGYNECLHLAGWGEQA